MTWIVIGGWLVCGVLSAGITFAWFQGDYTDHRYVWRQNMGWRQDLGCAILLGLIGGPVGLVIVFCLSGFCEDGWRLWPLRANKRVTRHP
jgi:MFS family permease